MKAKAFHILFLFILAIAYLAGCAGKCSQPGHPGGGPSAPMGNPALGPHGGDVGGRPFAANPATDGGLPPVSQEQGAPQDEVPRPPDPHPPPDPDPNAGPEGGMPPRPGGEGGDPSAGPASKGQGDPDNSAGPQRKGQGATESTDMSAFLERQEVQTFTNNDKNGEPPSRWKLNEHMKLLWGRLPGIDPAKEEVKKKWEEDELVAAARKASLAINQPAPDKGGDAAFYLLDTKNPNRGVKAPIPHPFPLGDVSPFVPPSLQEMKLAEPHDAAKKFLEESKAKNLSALFSEWVASANALQVALTQAANAQQKSAALAETAQFSVYAMASLKAFIAKYQKKDWKDDANVRRLFGAAAEILKHAMLPVMESLKKEPDPKISGYLQLLQGGPTQTAEARELAVFVQESFGEEAANLYFGIPIRQRQVTANPGEGQRRDAGVRSGGGLPGSLITAASAGGSSVGAGASRPKPGVGATPTAREDIRGIPQ